MFLYTAGDHVHAILLATDTRYTARWSGGRGVVGRMFLNPVA